MMGNFYFGFCVFGICNFKFGKFNFNFSGGFVICFDCDVVMNYNVEMDIIIVIGVGSYVVEIWNIDGLKINFVIVCDVGEFGLLL